MRDSVKGKKEGERGRERKREREREERERERERGKGEKKISPMGTSRRKIFLTKKENIPLFLIPILFIF